MSKEDSKVGKYSMECSKYENSSGKEYAKFSINWDFIDEEGDRCGTGINTTISIEDLLKFLDERGR